MIKKNSLSDDIVLIKASDKNDQNALSILYKKYKMIGERHARIYFANKGYDRYIADEYIGEIDIVFINAFHKFDRKLRTFRAYFIAILENSLNKYVGRILRNNDALKHYVPLDSSIDNIPLYELIEDKTISTDNSILDMLDVRMRISSYESSMKHQYKDIAKATIILKMQGYSFKEIGELLDVSESKVCRLYNDFRESLNMK